jgi:hypothetical protein
MNWKQKIAFRVKVIAADLSQSDFLSLILSETQAIEIGLVVNNAGFVRWYSDHWLPQSLLAVAFGCELRQPEVCPCSCMDDSTCNGRQIVC